MKRAKVGKELNRILEKIDGRFPREASLAEGDKRREERILRGSCLLWALLGILCMAWGFHTTDLEYGKMGLYVGVLVGNGGVLVSLLSAHNRGG